MSRTKKMIAALVLILTGFCLGVGVTTFFAIQRFRSMQPPEPDRMAMATERFLARRLHLTPQQREQARPILHDFARDMRQLRQEMAPRSREIVDRTTQRLEPILDPDQEQRLHQILNRARNRHPIHPQDRYPHNPNGSLRNPRSEAERNVE